MRALSIAAMTFAVLWALPALGDQIISKGRDRSYSVYRPTNLARSQLVPLVIVLYGGFGTGAQAEKTYHWDATADRNGFVVVYPDGFRRSWNAGGGCCGPASHDSVDDVGFIADLIRSVTRSENVDPKRVFLTGISNGAAMAYRYACEGALPIAAIGSVSGTMPGGCAAPHPVSALEIHGLKDQNIPFAGGVGTKGVTKVEWPGVEASLDLFRKAERCDATDTKVAGVVTTATANCADGRQVELITISDAGHQWPGGESNRPIARMLFSPDPPSTALDANAVIWAFFQRHPAPQ